MVSEMEGDLDDPGSNPPSAMKPPGDSGPLTQPFLVHRIVVKTKRGSPELWRRAVEQGGEKDPCD